MASKFILGSGIIGRIAKYFYPEYELIPIGRSRYYSFTPPLGENYLVAHESCDDLILDLYHSKSIIPYKRAFSISGHLTFNGSLVAGAYISKVYGDDALKSMLLRDSVMHVYGNVLITDLYDRLKPNLNNLDKYGNLNSVDIDNRTINTDKGTFEYEHIISTIPLDMLNDFIGVEKDLESRTAWIYLVATDQLDFEGANEVFVVEKEFDFYHVVNVSNSVYMFKCLREILTPDNYFGAFTNNKLQVLNKTKIDKYIPLGKPGLTYLEDADILPVGSMARWDDFCDVSTSVNILRRITRSPT